MSHALSVAVPLPGTRSVVPAYVLFAVLSIAVNLGVQGLAMAVVPGAPLSFAMACGTGAGFATKYLLDKHFIFQDRSADRRDEARKVALYGFFGVFTTGLFWASEAGLFALVGTSAARNAGAVLGLILGYALKFILDRRYTFTGARA